MSIYNQAFYAERNTRTRHAAEAVLSKVLGYFPEIGSAVDIGCGVGTWLHVVQQQGVAEIQGVDGPWVDTQFLEIPRECFRSCNFQDGIVIDLGRRYDLAISLEVAEHIDPAWAEDFVRLLTRLSDIVLFSAAVPGQGGLGHVNEQWPSYWVDLFAAQGYQCKDVLRSRIWSDGAIPWWYRQNIMLFGTPTKVARIEETAGIDLAAMPLIHPDHLKLKTEVYAGQAFRMFIGCVLKAVKRRLGSQGLPK